MNYSINIFTYNTNNLQFVINFVGVKIQIKSNTHIRYYILVSESLLIL